MRILTISGQNIASLAEAFVIDFTAEPLRSAGLFAITGETGAGKSSILDALCLALYGTCPRLDMGARSDRVPDAGGEVLAADDSRAVLSRGAVRGWAQVIFLGLDGESYSAKWEARRARDRVEGRLQAVARSVTRLSDGTVLDNQTSAVSARVRGLTGLSYDEFRRTVLLAQGDFDAFLRADTNDRAALLEKVTGTSLYRALSVRIYDRTTDLGTALRLQEAARAAHALLDDAALLAMAAERDSLTSEVAAGTLHRASLALDLDRHRQRTEALRQCEVAQVSLMQAQADQQATAPQRAQLAQIDMAEPLRLMWQRQRDAGVELDAALQAQTGAESAVNHALTALHQQQDLAAQAVAAHEAMETEFKDFGPIWTQATTLDSRIAGGAEEVQAADTTAGETLVQVTARQAEVAGLAELAAAATLRQTAAADRLQVLSPLAPLAARWPEVSRDLATRADLLRVEAGARQQAEALDRAGAGLAQQMTTLDADDQTDRAARDAHEARLQDIAAGITAHEAGAPQTLADGLSSLTAMLTTLDQRAQDHAGALAEGAGAEAAGTRAAEDLTAATTAIAAQDFARQMADAAVQALTAPHERAAAAASSVAAALRLGLVTGAPCPVCGALDHPVHASDAALADLARQAQADLDRARQAQAAALQALALARGAEAKAAAEGAQAVQSGAAVLARAARTARLWHDGRLAALTTGYCPDLPETPAPIAAALAETDRRRAAALDILRQIGALRHDQNLAAAAREAVAQRIDQRGSARRDLAGQIAQAVQQEALARQAISAAEQQRQGLEAGLAPVLAAAGEEFDSGDGALARRLEPQIAAHDATRAAHAAAQTELARLNPALQTARALTLKATEVLTAAQAILTRRVAALTALRTDRAALLGGEPTDPHRTRFNDHRLLAQTAREQALADLARAATHHASATTTLQAARSRMSTSQQAAGVAAERLQVALAPTGLQPETLDAILSLPAAEGEALRLSLRRADDAVISALSLRDARLQDLAAMDARGLPETPLTVLTALLADLDQTLREKTDRIAVIRIRLVDDATTRQSLAGLEAAIAAAKAELGVWQAVNMAVGSANGDRFARVAQSLTLDVLVARANHHLADLKPRYRLKRAGGETLALNIMDREMGDEERATRSLSGGERFLVSLALALALSQMVGRGGLAATLFIDEGFGALDSASLDLAIDALEALQAMGRTVGVISHVEAMKDRIPVQIRVQRQGGGRSRVSVVAPGGLVA